MHQLRSRLANARLYLCTDARRERGDLSEFADAVLAGGVDIIQLRDKGSPGEQRFGPLEAGGELAALEILADAAWHILTRDARSTTGRFFIDDEVLAETGITDLDPYSVVPGTKQFIPDFFVD